MRQHIVWQQHLWEDVSTYRLEANFMGDDSIYRLAATFMGLCVNIQCGSYIYGEICQHTVWQLHLWWDVSTYSVAATFV